MTNEYDNEKINADLAIAIREAESRLTSPSMINHPKSAMTSVNLAQDAYLARLERARTSGAIETNIYANARVNTVLAFETIRKNIRLPRPYR